MFLNVEGRADRITVGIGGPTEDVTGGFNNDTIVVGVGRWRISDPHSHSCLLYIDLNIASTDLKISLLLIHIKGALDFS